MYASIDDDGYSFNTAMYLFIVNIVPLRALQTRGWALELCAGMDDDGCSLNTAAYLFTVNTAAIACCLLCMPQARGWALELCAGIDDDGYSFNTAAYLFTVNIVLTEAGLQAGPGCGLAPVALLFQYLRLLVTTGVCNVRGGHGGCMVVHAYRHIARAGVTF